MNRKRTRVIFTFIVIVIGIYILCQLTDIMWPFVLGLFLAYLLNPLVCWLESKKITRKYAIAIIFFVIIGFFTLIIFVLLPALYMELNRLSAMLPKMLDNFNTYSENIKLNFLQAGLPREVIKLYDEKITYAQGFATRWLVNFLNDVPGILVSLTYLILSPVLAIYFLADWRKITRSMIWLVPRKYRSSWRHLLNEINLIINNYIHSNIVDAVIVGIVIGTGAAILGTEYALIIGIICGITNVIPYFGPVIGAVPSVILALSNSPSMAVKILILILIVQQIDGNIINPKLMSDKVGLHPLTVVFCLLAGEKLAGLLGMIIAIPLTAILRNIIYKTYFFLVSSELPKISEK